MLHVTFGTHKKKQSFGSETPERQHESSLCQAKKPFETWIPNDGCSKSRQRQIRAQKNDIDWSKSSATTS